MGTIEVAVHLVAPDNEGMVVSDRMGRYVRDFREPGLRF